ncbi:MAG: phosphatidylglycerophosphatase A [Coprobacter sp.]|nr:phosphatidylglycerophosphatase A [Coprobacter sp.]
MGHIGHKRPPFFATFIATGFGSGYSPIAPGTAGAALAVLLWIAGYMTMPFDALQMVLAGATLLFTALGVWAGNVMERYWGEDPSRVVVDEMVGVWIPLLVVPAENWWYVLAAFVLFRLFDIVKPLGVRRMERLGGGLGIMMDDILAGVYSALLLVAARLLIG